MKHVAAGLLALIALAGCAEISEATHMLSGQTYPPTSPEAVTIYLEKPAFEYMTVGTVEARGMGYSNEARDQELAVKALKREAASIGAHGVIITDSQQQIARINKYGTSTERRIKGIAIRRP